jgi:hypothetical protein
VLNLSVHATPNPPRVVSTSLTEGTVLDGPPTQFTVRFTEPVNLQRLGFENYLATLYCSIPSVYFQGLDGKKLYPRLDAYDPATNQATFLMLDRLPTGSYTLHLSGPGGLADLGGNPLVGNDPTGDFVVHLTVNATDVLASGSSWQGGRFEARPDAEGTQDLGVLFPHELQTVLTLDYNASEVKDQTPGIGQRYRFTLLQGTNYFFRLLGDALPQGATMTLREGSGHFVLILNQDSGRTWFGDFMPGSYVLEVGGMASDTSYHIAFQMIGSSDDPVPLVTGPAPSLQLRFESIAPPSPPGGSTSTGGGMTPVLPIPFPLPRAHSIHPRDPARRSLPATTTP